MINTNTLGHKEDISLISNAFGFLRLPLCFEPYESDADVAITGVPFDMACSARSGARLGPNAIRQVSPQLAWEHCRFPWDFDVRDKLKIVDCGDLVYSFGDGADFCKCLTGHISRLLKAEITPLTFGGDHFVTLPILRAVAKKYGPVSLLHFDAHSDTYENGSRYDHGTMFYTSRLESLIDVEHSVQFGIRTEFDKNLGFTVLTAPEANDLSVSELAAKIKAVIGDRPVYLTFDIDCLDPAYAPGTGTPVCGGLSTDKILKLLRALKALFLIGMDIVEVSPAYDKSELTALAAATIALEMLYMKGSRR